MFELLRRVAAWFNLFPCLNCMTGDGDGCNRFCPRCLAELKPLTGDCCRGCGGPVDNALAFCSLCLDAEERPWRAAVSVFSYDNQVKEVIYALKFRNVPAMARPLGELLAERVRRAGFPVEAVVPVPLHPLRQLGRGYNQAALLGRVIAHDLGIRQYCGWLWRCRNTEHQARLAMAERHRNLNGVFAAGRGVRGKQLLLVDDVFTTGSTLAAAAQALLEAGAAAVYVAAVARTPGRLRRQG